MARDDELTALREEIESLAAFLRLLQQEHTQLHIDFAAALRAAGGTITVAAADFKNPFANAIDRIEDRQAGTTTFRLRTE